MAKHGLSRRQHKAGLPSPAWAGRCVPICRTFCNKSECGDAYHSAVIGVSAGSSCLLVITSVSKWLRFSRLPVEFDLAEPLQFSLLQALPCSWNRRGLRNAASYLGQSSASVDIYQPAQNGLAGCICPVAYYVYSGHIVSSEDIAGQPRSRF